MAERRRPAALYALAIYNYSPLPESSPKSINLHIGELVEILNDTADKWYFGHRVCRNSEERGIFPKNFVRLKECSVDRTGSVEVVSIIQPQIVQEITHTLREWGRHWKELYVKHDQKQFKCIEQRMRTLMELRCSILSGKLPLDQLKKIQRTAIYTMDVGNRELNMALTVRCSVTGGQIDPSKVSTYQLHNLHVETSDKIKNEKQEISPSVSSFMHNTSFSLFASVRNFVCKMNEDAQLLISLYDAVTHKHFTESYVVRWSRDGLASDIDQLHNLKVLFTDLGTSDVKKEKVFLVCYAIRIGGMESQVQDNRRSSVANALALNMRLSQSSSITSNGETNFKSVVNMRRPLGVAAMDITKIMSGDLDVDEEKQYYVSFFPIEKENNLETLLKKIVQNKEIKGETKTGQGLWISIKLLQGDLKQIREELPHLVVGNISIARKMGFPEVILPSDARNDLYLNLLSGSFTRGGTKATDRNIQVTVRVCNQYGQLIPGVIYLGGGVQPLDEYNSVIYYHDDKPRWHEIFKICVPIEEFKLAHILFLFKHRSSNESKDKAEKPFAISFTRLMQSNGTTLNDTTHLLRVYKVDNKKWPNDIDAASCYLELPSEKSYAGDKDNVKMQKGFLSYSPKDYFSMETTVCSTKLTQNVELLGVLNWCDKISDDSLRKSLTLLQHVPGGEVVKFLQDILDALFSILTQANLEKPCDSSNISTDSYDYLVFESLLFVILLVSDRKFHHFQPVLDLYIKESFCATLAYQKLCRLLSRLILDKADKEKNEVLLKSMKSLEYLMRFIVKSRELHAELTQRSDQHDFQKLFNDLLESIIVLLQCNSMNALTSQGSCIKYLPAAVPYMIQVFPDTELSTIIGKMLDVLPLNKLTKQRLMAVLDLVQGPLFRNTNCRCILLPHITNNLKIIIQNNDELELCIKILGEILTLLSSKDIGPTDDEFNHIATTLLQTTILATSQMDRDNPLVYQLISILLDMLRQMTNERYNIIMSSFSTDELLRFIIEVQMLLKDLVEKPVFLSHWTDMLNLQNSIVLKVSKLFSTTLVEMFMNPFRNHVWSNWFHLAISFLTQPSLQLEQLLTDQRRRLTTHYGDMRIEAAHEIKKMWFSLGEHKSLFIPELVAPFLEMSLIPETDVRKTAMPLFFDMMECEFNLTTFIGDFQSGINMDLFKKGNFDEFENEMIHKLDVLVEGGLGDAQWTTLFKSYGESKWLDQPTLKNKGQHFVTIIVRLLDTLLQYRKMQDDSSMDHRMQTITTLLDFYSKIKRPEMYIRYVNKLCELHLECENWTEAGLTLQLHAKLLQWSNTPLNALLKSHRHPNCQTHRDLKEALCYEIIDYLDKGKIWETAVVICKELVKQYEEEIYDYVNLSDLYKKMAKYYHNIMHELRSQPGYFRVGYYGKGFPEFLQNKAFIYRGKDYERLEDFCSRILNGLPNAELMGKLSPPGEDILNSPNQYVQINAVETIMSENFNISIQIHDQISKYYKFNELTKFRYSRPFHRHDEALAGLGDESGLNEFASLWLERTELEIGEKLPGILRWFPVVKSRTYEMSPLQVAIDTMEKTNKALDTLIKEHSVDSTLPLDPLTRKLNGVVDAAVMGGVTNYEKVFFTEIYQNAHPEHEHLIKNLKSLIAEQIPILEFGIEVHKSKLPISLAPLHKRILECFEKTKAHVHEKYGKRTYNIDKDTTFVTMRRRISGLEGTRNSDNRWSGLSSTTNASDRTGLSFAKNNSSLRTTFTSPFNKQTNRASTGMSDGLMFRYSSMASRSTSILTLPNKRKEKEKKLRNRKQSEISLATPETPNSLWYTDGLPTFEVNNRGKTNSICSDVVSPSSIVELSQELIPTRPLRSEVEKEKRLSQRQSLQSTTNSNRNSAGTDSNISTDDDPPPLPQKTVKFDTNYSPPTIYPKDDSYYQAINFNMIGAHTDNSNNVTPIMGRQNYDTVMTPMYPRGSFLYNSGRSPNHVLHKNRYGNKDKKPPTPPPKKRVHVVTPN